MTVIAVPKVLREKLGEDGADALISLINQSQLNNKADVLQFVEEKFERRLSEEMAKINQRITEEIARVNQRISTEIAGINERISTEIAGINQRIGSEIAGVRGELANARADLIKWMFIFWIGQIGAIIGILFAFFK